MELAFSPTLEGRLMEAGFHRLSKMQICNLIKNVPDISYSLRYK